MKGAKTIAYAGAALLLAHFVLRQLRREQPKIRYVEKLPCSYNAVTIPPFGIYIEDQHKGNNALLEHELIHWKQYQSMGLLPYYGKYVKDLFFHGYDLHPMEVQARANENEFCRVNYTECVRTGQAKTLKDPDFRKLIMYS